MNVIVKELKRINKYVGVQIILKYLFESQNSFVNKQILKIFQLDLDDLTVENAIARKFHKQLQYQLDPIWHQLGGTTKQLVADLKMLGSFLTQVSFN